MTIDLTGLKVVTLADIEAAAEKGAKEVLTAEKTIFTPSAKEALQLRGLTHRTGTANSAPPTPAGMAPSNPRLAALFDSSEARAAKEEICAVGKKLWMRQYVDGNGGNISYRI